ncbi:MAG: DedA family protein [Patescibacteria group bacterium]
MELISSLLGNPYLLYGTITFLTWIEGPIITLICGTLLRTVGLPVVPTFIAVVVGDLIGDSLWYAIGYHGGQRFVHRFGKYISLTEERITTAMEYFHKYHERILLLSKLSMGFGFAIPTLVVAGMTRIPFRRFLSINAFGQMFWSGVLLAIGYYASHLYLTIGSVLGKASLLSGVVLILLIFFGFRNYLKKRILEETL